MWQERDDLFQYSQSRLGDVAQDLGGRLLHTPGNPISLAVSLAGLADAHLEGGSQEGGTLTAITHVSLILAIWLIPLILWCAAGAKNPLLHSMSTVSILHSVFDSANTE